MPRKAAKMKGKFPHYDCQVQTGVTLPRTPTGHPKTCKACKAPLAVGDFTISESGTIILAYNGRVDESGGPTQWTNWYHAVGCFGFYADTLSDDKIRVGKIAKKLGLVGGVEALSPNPLFAAEYDQELLKRRFSGFDGLPVKEQNIVRTIMIKGAFAEGDPLIAPGRGGAAAAAPAAAITAAAAAGGVKRKAGDKRKKDDAEDEADDPEDADDDAADGKKAKKSRAATSESAASAAASSKKKKPTAASRKKKAAAK